MKLDKGKVAEALAKMKELKGNQTFFFPKPSANQLPVGQHTATITGQPKIDEVRIKNIERIQKGQLFCAFINLPINIDGTDYNLQITESQLEKIAGEGLEKLEVEVRDQVRDGKATGYKEFALNLEAVAA